MVLLPKDKFSKKLPFGKYKGMTIEQLPIDYLKWMAEKLPGGDFDEYAKLAVEALRSSDRREEMSAARLESAADELLKQAGYTKFGQRRGEGKLF